MVLKSLEEMLVDIDSDIVEKKKKVNRFMFWIPRILSIVFVLFLFLMSLDVFSEGLGFWGTVLGLFMHNIPAIILLIVLIISWKYEIVGGIAFVFAGLLYIVSVLPKIFQTGFHWYYLLWFLMISGPALLIGILFFIGWYKKK